MAGRGSSYHPRFPDTRSSLVWRIAHQSQAGWREAWAEFFALYYRPLYCVLRLKGCPPEQAEDLLQSWLLALIEGDLLKGYVRSEGRLRTYLCKSLDHRKIDALRKLGVRPMDRAIPLSHGEKQRLEQSVADHQGMAPEAAFERLWAQSVIEASLKAFAESLAGRPDDVIILNEWIRETNGAPGTEAEFGIRLGISARALRGRSDRLCKKLRKVIIAEVRRTTDPEDEVDGEVKELLNSLAVPRPKGGTRDIAHQ